MEITDTHTHTWFSGHGDGTPEELVSQASKLGLTTLAVTEHLDFPVQMDPAGQFGMTAEQVPVYIDAVKAARACHPELEVILGTEIDWRDGAEDFILERISPFEILLGSVHMLTDGPDLRVDNAEFWPFDYAPEIDGWQHYGVQAVWEQYVRLWLDAVNSKVPFTIMAHPDLPKKLGFRPNFDADYLWEQMVEAAAARNVLIEVNTSGLFAPCAEAYPALDLLTRFCQAKVACTIGSDAHTPANVARAHSEACSLMRQAGYHVVTVPTRDGDRREIALD